MYISLFSFCIVSKLKKKLSTSVKFTKVLDCGLSKYLDRISLSGKTDYHCKVKETLFIRELQPALNANISSEKLYISFYRQFPFETS